MVQSKNDRKHSYYLMACIMMCFLACTNLETPVYDQVDRFWQTEDQIAAGIAPAYAWMRNLAPLGGAFSPGIYPLAELSTDALLIPTRGSDWSDGGVWEAMWKHTWTEFHPHILQGWEFVYTGIARINSIQKSLEELSARPANYSAIQAELLSLKAYYYFWAIDLFGQVPIVETTDLPIDQIRQSSRKDVFNHIESLLIKNSIALAKNVDPRTYGRMTYWANQFLRAKLYLNAEVYSGQPRWIDCIKACDEILNSKLYQLETDFFSNFKIENTGSKEIIWAIPFDFSGGLNYFWLQSATLHYFSSATFGIQEGGANGLCSSQAFYNLFQPMDIRKKGFLAGQQYINQEEKPSNLQYDSQNNLLFFDPILESFALKPPKAESAGVRVAKWEFNSIGAMSNDFAIFRLADVILMKAEAEMKLGDKSKAEATLNQRFNAVSIRSRAGLNDIKISEINEDGILMERANELAWECWRRNDLIRLGHFTDARSPDKLVSENYRKLFPIPKSVLDRNKNFVQNPGY
jgi:starch-binding outer membrane protein, SusD/RagB family